jgi:SAM-dependent methyltransferase
MVSYHIPEIHACDAVPSNITVVSDGPSTLFSDISHMDGSDSQTEYWNRAASDREFTHPLDFERFKRVVSPEARILDHGCGYGRICHRLRKAGYRNVIGIDTADGMIREGMRRFPELDLRHITAAFPSFPAESFDVVLLFAVLTCIPSDKGQQRLIASIERTLRIGGILYVSDYFLQADQRNRERYERFEPEFETYGVFELSDGAVLRHHTRVWIEALLAGFRAISLEEMVAPTCTATIV